MLGPPGCGKGTQGRLLTRLLDIPAYSTGDILREQGSLGTALGNEVRRVLNAGALVNDDLVNRTMTERLADAACSRGVILDGYPRTVAQAQHLDRLLKKKARQPAVVLHFEIDEATVLSRLTSRRYCPVCGRVYNLVSQPPADIDFCDDDGMILVARKDDDPAIVRERLRHYDQLTGPVIRHYRGRLHRIDATRGAQELLTEIESRLGLPVSA